MLASTALKKYFHNCDICSLNETTLYQRLGWQSGWDFSSFDRGVFFICAL